MLLWSAALMNHSFGLRFGSRIFLTIPDTKTSQSCNFVPAKVFGLRYLSFVSSFFSRNCADVLAYSFSEYSGSNPGTSTIFLRWYHPIVVRSNFPTESRRIASENDIQLNVSTFAGAIGQSTNWFLPLFTGPYFHPSAIQVLSSLALVSLALTEAMEASMTGVSFT